MKPAAQTTAYINQSECLNRATSMPIYQSYCVRAGWVFPCCVKWSRRLKSWWCPILWHPGNFRLVLLQCRTIPVVGASWTIHKDKSSRSNQLPAHTLASPAAAAAIDRHFIFFFNGLYWGTFYLALEVNVSLCTRTYLLAMYTQFASRTFKPIIYEENSCDIPPLSSIADVPYI